MGEGINAYEHISHSSNIKIMMPCKFMDNSSQNDSDWTNMGILKLIPKPINLNK